MEEIANILRVIQEQLAGIREAQERTATAIESVAEQLKGDQHNYGLNDLGKILSHIEEYVEYKGK